MRGFKDLSAKTRGLVLASVVFFIAAALYSNTLLNGFVMDDSTHIVGNRFLRDMRYVPDIFSSSFWIGYKTSYYRPFVDIIFMSCYRLFGLEAWGFHLMNVLFNAGVSVLVFFTVALLLRKQHSSGVPSADGKGAEWAPFASALLFAAHPIHTEAVAYICGLSDLSAEFFCLLSFCLYIRGASSRVSYAFSVVSFFLAALSKEPALTLPAILIAYDCAFRKEGAPVSYYLKRYVPYFAAVAVYFALRLNALGGVAPVGTPVDLSFYRYILAVVALFSKYIGKLVVPAGLNVWHIFRTPVSPFSASGIISFIITVVFLVVCAIMAWKSRAALLGILFIVLPLAPAFYLPALSQGIENAFTERYLYIPSFGFAVLIAVLISWASEKRPQWGAAIAVVLSMTAVLYSIDTVSRNFAWKDDLTIWADAARKSPDSPIPHVVLGGAMKEKGMIDGAIEQYMMALRLKPRDAYAHLGLGLAYADKGWNDKAMEQLQTSLSLNPRYAAARDSLGVLYGSLGQHDKAAAEFQAALNLNPDLDYVYKHLGIAYSNLGLKDRAIENFQTALRLNPDDADTHNNMGIIYAERGMMGEAVEQFEAAVRLKPADASFRYNAARAYKEIGMADKSEEQIRIAKSLERGNP